MKLSSLTVSGYKRFLEPETLKINGKMTVLVGPNEAGKTTILKALAHLSNSNPISDSEKYRFEDDIEPSIKAVFRLEPSDNEAIENDGPRELHVQKAEDGQISTHITPRIKRPTSHRSAFKRLLERCLSSPAFSATLSSKLEALDPDEDEQEALELNNLSESIKDIRFEEDDLYDEDIKAVQALVSFFTDSEDTTFPKFILGLSESARNFIAIETTKHPNEVARVKLSERRPRLLEFTAKDRALETEYDMQGYAPEEDAHRKEPCTPLANLCEVAGLSLDQLNTNYLNDRHDRIASQIANANNKLNALFASNWSQSDVSIELTWSEPFIRIMVRHQRDGTLAHNFIRDRSDGFKQYVALLAFILKEDAQRPILLIDEAELHLHYDAQADLIQTFTSRNLASQVVYTTHSAGCLPEDMGLGVKLVVPNGQEGGIETSRVVNSFWNNSSLGFSPLLYGMGANTLAFFPTRRAVVTEGQTEMLLLPTIFRQVAKTEFNGFQVVPGLASASKKELPQADLQGSSVAYLVDNDGAGDGYISALAKLGVPAERMLKVGIDGSTIITFEDWIDCSSFERAVKEYRSRHFSEKDDVPNGYFEGDGKAAKLKQYETDISEEISKVTLAYILLEFVTDDDECMIYNANHKDRIESVRGALVDVLELPTNNVA